MQFKNILTARQKRILKTILIVICTTAAGIFILSRYVSLYESIVIEGIGRRSEKEAVRNIFKAHLENEYSGTNYDGEFVVDGEITVSSTLYSTGYGTYAYRADIPEVKFFMRSSGSAIGTEDRFLETFIAWGGAQAMGDEITRIYGDEIIYKITIGYGEKSIFIRNGYEDIVAHYNEDKTYPYIEIVVFTNEFDFDKACDDAVELYEAFVAGRSEERFYIEVLYSNSDNNERGAINDRYSVTLKYSTKPDNILPQLRLDYNYREGDNWQNEYSTFDDFVKDNFWTKDKGSSLYVTPYR